MPSTRYNPIEIPSMDNEKRQLTPSEILFQQLENPLDTTVQASELNNGAVRLFIEGQLVNQILPGFSKEGGRISRQNIQYRYEYQKNAGKKTDGVFRYANSGARK
jgi:hypothetical protein